MLFISIQKQKSKALVFRVVLPVLSDRVVALLGNNDCPVSLVGPDEVAVIVREASDHLEVGLGQELVVKDPVGELEPVSFVLPEENLKREIIGLVIPP